MAKKKKAEKEETEVAVETNKVEKRVTKKQPKNDIRLYSLEELARLMGLGIPQMRSLYLIRGLDKNEKLSLQEAYDKFKTIA